VNAYLAGDIINHPECLHQVSDQSLSITENNGYC
jgi:hypothetical protein